MPSIAARSRPRRRPSRCLCRGARAGVPTTGIARWHTLGRMQAVDPLERRSIVTALPPERRSRAPRSLGTVPTALARNRDDVELVSAHAARARLNGVNG